MTILDIWHEHWQGHQGNGMQLATHPDTDDLYRWQAGVWQNITPRFPRILMTETGVSASRNAVEAALYEATSTSPYLDGDQHGLDSDEPWVNFRNGVFDLAAGELRPHSGPWFTVNQIPHDYRDDLDPVEVERETLALDSYMRERVADDTANAGVLWQLLGSAMLPGNPGQTFAILQGPGGSGKGTYLSILRDVLGSENVTTLSLGQLGDRFAASSLHGVLGNVAGDVTGGVVPAYELILGITGGDSITADRKYRTPLAFVWDGLLILATNGRLVLPSGAGSESGWWRRGVYIDMPNAVPAGERVSARELRHTIAPDLDRVATRAVNELRAAWEFGASIPVETVSMARSLSEARTTGNTVLDWAEDRLTPDPIGGESLMGVDAYRDYRTWCETYGHRPKGHTTFYADLGNVLVSKGWGERGPRTNASRAVFHGVALPGPVRILQVV